MYTIKESLKYGWEKFLAYMWLCVGATVLVFAFDFLGQDQGFLLSLLLIVLGLIVKIGYTKIFLRIADGESPKFVDIFQEYGYFWNYLATSILQGLATLGGLILLIIPGIIWSIRFSFATVIILDAKTKPVEAMKESYVITKGKFWQLLGFYLILGLINLAGILALGIGLFVSVPVTLFAYIYVYRELTKTKAGVMVETASPQIT